MSAHPVFPVLFAAHGSPMNVVSDNAFTRALRSWSERLPKPRAVVCVSAHWVTRGLRILSSEWPRTIHDFGGFPEELYRIRYPAPGAPELARRLEDLLKTEGAQTTEDWGLDHGTWGVLSFLYPKADVPVIQLSLDARRSPEEHYKIGRKLKDLRQEGILIAGSGNIVHNLGRMGPADAPPEDWAVEFDEGIKDALKNGDVGRLVEYERAFSSAARLSAPTPEHYLPLIYGLAAAEGEEPAFIHEGFEHAAISQRCVQWG
jgi:4,5-DOPA dioxygenase extradiol